MEGKKRASFSYLRHTWQSICKQFVGVLKLLIDMDFFSQQRPKFILEMVKGSLKFARLWTLFAFECNDYAWASLHRTELHKLIFMKIIQCMTWRRNAFRSRIFTPIICSQMDLIQFILRFLPKRWANMITPNLILSFFFISWSEKMTLRGKTNKNEWKTF